MLVDTRAAGNSLVFPVRQEKSQSLFNVPGDQFGHLEHADLTLAIEDWLEGVVRVDHGSFLLILTTVFLDVIPKLFREFGARQWLRANNGGKLFVGLHWSHESSIRFAFGGALAGSGFRHRG